MIIYLDGFIIIFSLYGIIINLINNNIGSMVFSLVFFIITIINTLFLINKNKYIFRLEESYYIFIRQVSIYLKNGDYDLLNEFLKNARKSGLYRRFKIDNSSFSSLESIKDLYDDSSI